LPASAILKLYNRRCLVDIYDKPGMLWSFDKEREHRRYLHDVATGAVARRDFNNPTYWKNPVPHGEFQAYLQHTAQKCSMRSSRCTNSCVPSKRRRSRRCTASETAILYVVEYKIAVSDACTDESTVTKTVPGLLLKHVPSLTLRELVATMCWLCITAARCTDCSRSKQRIITNDTLDNNVYVPALQNLPFDQLFFGFKVQTYAPPSQESSASPPQVRFLVHITLVSC
ncbi:hypothetical protein LXA43DRAFT_904959, partial [Ganoderma leucocontextum]